MTNCSATRAPPGQSAKGGRAAVADHVAGIVSSFHVPSSALARALAARRRPRIYASYDRPGVCSKPHLRQKPSRQFANKSRDRHGRNRNRIRAAARAAAAQPARSPQRDDAGDVAGLADFAAAIEARADVARRPRRRRGRAFLRRRRHFRIRRGLRRCRRGARLSEAIEPGFPRSRVSTVRRSRSSKARRSAAASRSRCAATCVLPPRTPISPFRPPSSGCSMDRSRRGGWSSSSAPRAQKTCCSAAGASRPAEALAIGLIDRRCRRRRIARRGRGLCARIAALSQTSIRGAKRGGRGGPERRGRALAARARGGGGDRRGFSRGPRGVRGEAEAEFRLTRGLSSREEPGARREFALPLEAADYRGACVGRAPLTVAWADPPSSAGTPRNRRG